MFKIFKRGSAKKERKPRVYGLPTEGRQPVKAIRAAIIMRDKHQIDLAPGDVLNDATPKLAGNLIARGQAEPCKAVRRNTHTSEGDPV